MGGEALRTRKSDLEKIIVREQHFIRIVRVYAHKNAFVFLIT